VISNGDEDTSVFFAVIPMVPGPAPGTIADGKNAAMTNTRKEKFHGTISGYSSGA